MKTFRKFSKIIFIALSRLINPFFFDEKFLMGRWFGEKSSAGWLWAWRGIWWQKVLGFNRHIPWPVSPQIRISNSSNIVFHPDDLNNFQSFGIYLQNFAGKIVIGKGTYIAPNVGIITSNHDPSDLNKHLPGKDVRIGRSCWIGMNAVLLPGVVLGDKTIVGAGSIVTKSFPNGNCIIAGNPANILKEILDEEKD